MNKKTATLFVLKEAKKYKKSKIRKRQEIYLKPFKEQKKPWVDVALDYSVDFIEALDNILNSYKNSCLDIIQNNKKLFKLDNQVKKSKNYKTNEYLDERYNHVVVDDIKDKLLELNNSFSNALNKAYEKHIIKGSLSDATGLVFKGMGMDFDFNKYDESTRDYLRDKKINWSKNVADTTEKGVKRQLVNGYEDGLSSYDIALNINQSSNFKFSRCEAIARTEIISSCNYADYIAFMENPNVIGLRWSSSGDKRVRPTHKAADGEKRKKVKKDNHYELEKPFIVGSSKLKYPGDNSLGAEAKELVRCRCTLYPVFKGEDIESTTIYDDKDVGSEQWFLRQSNLFQNSYTENNAKTELIHKGFLKLKDVNKSWNEIKQQFLIKTTNNFNKINLDGPFKDMDTTTKNLVLNAILDVLKYGLDKSKENLCALDISRQIVDLNNYENLKVFKNIEARDENKSTIKISDAEEKLIDDCPKNSVILIHNHPDGITLSPNDMITFLKHSSVKCIIAVGHNGNIYAIWANRRKKYNISEDKWDQIAESLEEIVSKKTKNKIIMAKNPKDRLNAMNVYEGFMKDLYSKYGINYIKGE